MPTKIAEKLKEWALDWVDRSGTEPSGGRSGNPLTNLPQLFAALAAIVAVLSSPAISVLVPDLNANAALVLRAAIALATLIAVNHVVTAKDTVPVPSPLRSETVRRYRFSRAERMIARGIVVVGALIWSLNYVPAPAEPEDCGLDAIVTAAGGSGGAATPVALLLQLGDREERISADLGKRLAMLVPSEHLSAWRLVLIWSDGSRSDFGEFSGCPAEAQANSQDGRVKIVLKAG
jgi:hypothetical protein